MTGDDSRPPEGRPRPWSRKRTANFGWFAYAPPRWWPRNHLAQRAFRAGLGGGVTVRYALLPSRHPQLREALLPRAESFTPEYWREEFALRPVETLAWTPDFGEFGEVDGLVGRGFDAYVRILHPVELHPVEGPGSGMAEDAGRRLSWGSLPDARLDQPGWRPDRSPDGSIDFDHENRHGVELSEGFVPGPERRVLHELLQADLTEQGDESRVVQGIWTGIGGLAIDDATACRIDQPERDIVPFTGAFDEIVLVDEWHTAAIVHPESGAWCLANDTDLVSTYLGCSRALAQRFLDDPRLECLVVGPKDSVG